MKSLFTIIIVVMACLQLQAQIFVRHDATGANDGSSWTNAYTDLQDALDDSASGSEIWIAAGVYKPTGPTPDSSHFISTRPVQIYGGFIGTETALDQRNWEVNQTIISGDLNGDDIRGQYIANRTDNAHHVLIINAPETESLIDGIFFEGGSARTDFNNYAPDANDIPYNRWSGGALYLYRSGAVVRNSIFQDNYAVRGSGCYAFGDTLHTIALEFDNVIFRDNNGYNGAATFISAFQDAKITNSQVIKNAGYQGGGLFFSGSNATLHNCVLDSNSATYGGAINVFHSSLNIQHPEIKVINSSFTGNTASAWGGGLFVNNTYGGFSVEIDSSSFTGNANGSNGFGGGLQVWDAQDALPKDPLSTIRITNSEFIANTSNIGGGAEIELEDDSVRVILENVKFEENNATRGGGLTVYAYAASKLDFLMRNAAFTGNVAAIAGGMSMEGINNINTLNYIIEDCSFTNNTGNVGVGALNLQHHPRRDGIEGVVRRVSFEDNHGVGLSGAYAVFHGIHTVEDSYFFSNSTDASLDSLYHGGGAISAIGPAGLSVNRSIFDSNTSATEGSAIAATDSVTSIIENTLFHHQEGGSTIYFDGDLNLMNTTMVDNAGGLFLQHVSETKIQNSVFDNAGANLRLDGKPTIISGGGNISSDVSMSDFLAGSAGFEDRHNTEPLLGTDYYPLTGSPVVDAGNPTGVAAEVDLAGNPRAYGNSIDAGSYESFLVAVQNAAWDSEAFTVFPNPVKETLHFDVVDSWHGNVQVSIFSLHGQLMLRQSYQKQSERQHFELTTSLIPGEYFMIVHAGAKRYGKTIIVQ